MKRELKNDVGQKQPAPERGNRLHVVPEAGGWAVKRPGVRRSMGVYGTQAEATRAAQETLRAKGGELRIQGRDGRWRESFTLGRNAMGKISAVEGICVTGEMKRDLQNYDRRKLPAEERRKAIAGKYGKKPG